MAGNKEFTIRNPTEIQNPDYKNDINYNIELYRWFLKLIGIWPTTHKSTWREILTLRALNVIHSAMVGFIFISTFLYVVVDVHDVQLRLMKLGPVVYTAATLMKYWLMISNETDIRRCVDHIEIDWKEVKRQEDRRIMLQSAQIGRQIIAISATCGFAGVILFRVVAPLNLPKIVVGNLSYRQLAYPVSKLIIDTRQSPANEIMILVQCICGFIGTTITVGSCSMVATCALHARGQLKIIICWLNYFVNGRPNENDTIDMRLSDIVRKHMRILSFIARTENIMHGISFSEVIASTVNMCMIGYYVLRGWNHVNNIRMLTYFILLAYFVMNILIICYIGDLLAEEYQKMAEATYMIDWYEIKGKKALSLVLIYSMSLSTPRLTAGKFIELSITSFGDIVRTAVAYLNMLRTVTS